MTFGEKLRKLRTLRNISQLQLAEDIGVSRQTLSKWENDAVLPDIHNVIVIAEYFRVPTDYLLLDDNSCKEQTNERKFTIESIVVEWLINRENWLFIFLVVYFLIVVLSWLVYEDNQTHSLPF